MLEMTEVQSSTVSAVGYDEVSGEMRIQFSNGTVYAYENVPVKIYTDMLEAKSKGWYVSEYVKNKFPFRKVTNENP